MGTYLASKTRANIPAANGAEADVPEWLNVHSLWRSVVTCVRFFYGELVKLS